MGDFLFELYYFPFKRINFRLKFLYLGLKHYFLLRKVSKLRVELARLGLIVERHTGVNQACNFSHVGISSVVHEISNDRAKGRRAFAASSDRRERP